MRNAQKNRGYNATLKSAFKKAGELGTQIIITVDADGYLEWV